AEQRDFRQERGVREGRARLAAPAARVHPLVPVVDGGAGRDLHVLELVRGQEHGRLVRAREQRAVLAEEQARVRLDLAGGELLELGLRRLAAVVPRQEQRAARRERGRRERVVHARPERIALVVRRWTVRADRERRAQLEEPQRGIHQVAAHVALRA